MRHPRQRGFTLVEIAIVLVIIGLLLGGVFKGQELIVQAKIRNIISDINGISAAVYAYQDRYRALPGDDRTVAVSRRWSGASGGNGDGVICGGYNGASEGDACTTALESLLIWQHLRRAGLLAGSPDDGVPQNAASGLTGIQAGAFGLAGHVICASNLSAKMAAALDAQLDDGQPNTGSLRAELQTSPNQPARATPSGLAGYLDDGSQLYLVCKTL
jgi:prepilin-type N-terminal cleavage/methylation domain-containing protein